LRRSELAGLRLDEIADGDGMLQVDSKGLTVTLLRYKTEKGEPAVVSIARSAAPETWRAVRAWIDRAGIDRGTPVMRMITPNGFIAARGITGQGIGIALRAAVRTLIGQKTR
jgi:hypothetical protein